MKSDLEYFRRAIRDSVGWWLADGLRAEAMPSREDAAMMERARDYLLRKIDHMEIVLTPDHGVTAQEAATLGRAAYDRAVAKGDRNAR